MAFCSAIRWGCLGLAPDLDQSASLGTAELGLRSDRQTMARRKLPCLANGADKAKRKAAHLAPGGVWLCRLNDRRLAWRDLGRMGRPN